MPYIQLSPAYNPYTSHQQASLDPFLSFLTAALSPEPTSKPKQQPSEEAPKRATPPPPAQCRAACAPRQTHHRVYKRLINPSFDVSELPSQYILEGELPGVSDKSSISISFDDAQTIVVKGEVKRVNRLAGHASEEVAETTTTPAEKPVVPTTATTTEENSSSKRHSVTVEEVADESETSSNADDFELLDGPTPSKTDKGKQRATEETKDVEMTEATTTPAAPAPSVPKEEVKEELKPRYWISERAVGVFERRFNFQGLIDQDNVKASLENGLLTIVVPKRGAYVRQINIE